MKTKEIIDFLPNNVASSVLSDQDFGIAGMSDERLVALWKKSPLESFREAVLGEDSYTLNWGKPCQHCGSSTFQKDGVLYCSHCNKKTVECSCKRQESLDLRLVQFRKSLYFELKERNLIEDIGKKSKDKKRYVYGTRDNRWHLVGPEDRDYESGLSPEQFEKLGPEKSKELYLRPVLLRTESEEDLSDWIEAGFTPEEAKKWIKRGYGDPSQVPKGEIGESKNLVKFYCKTCNKGFEAKEFTRHQSHDWKIEQLEHESVEEIVNDLLGEKSPPGFEGTVKAMKKYKDIDNPWALAWWMKKKGYKSHKGKK
jgi:hypothetical protein